MSCSMDWNCMALLCALSQRLVVHSRGIGLRMSRASMTEPVLDCRLAARWDAGVEPPSLLVPSCDMSVTDAKVQQ